MIGRGWIFTSTSIDQIIKDLCSSRQCLVCKQQLKACRARLIPLDDIALTLDETAHQEDPNTGSEPAFQWVYKWLSNCLRSHPECQKFNNLPYPLPARVLDVGDEDGSEDPYLYIPNFELNSQLYAYLTLSHRWGSSKMLTTTMENIEKRQTGIPLSEMPDTFRDAVIITRKLGIRYLWIDSLCIIQNSAADWEAEAAKMGNIYRHSLLTIAALSSTDSMSGCFAERKEFFGRPCKLGLKVPEGVFGWRSGGVYVRLKQGEGDNAIFAERAKERGPLDSRGWVLQERVLSTRILNYSSQELRWECISHECSESIPEGLEQSKIPEDNPEGSADYGLTGLIKAISLKRRNTDFIHTIKRVIGGFTDPSNERELETFHFSWLLLIELYSRRQLTVEADKLVAMAGMVTEIQKVTRDVFLAGLWKRYFWKELLWSVKTSDTVVMGGILHDTPRGPPSHRLTILRLPTWSWVSVSGWIRYADNEFEKLSDHDLLVEILDVVLENPEDQFSKHTVTGTLTLRGTLKRAMSMSTASPTDYGDSVDRSHEIKSLKTGEYVGYFVRDETERLFKEVLCIAMTRSLDHIWCIAVEPTRRKGNEYKRIGLVWWRERQWDEVDPSETATITII